MGRIILGKRGTGKTTRLMSEVETYLNSGVSNPLAIVVCANVNQCDMLKKEYGTYDGHVEYMSFGRFFARPASPIISYHPHPMVFIDDIDFIIGSCLGRGDLAAFSVTLGGKVSILGKGPDDSFERGLAEAIAKENCERDEPICIEKKEDYIRMAAGRSIKYLISVFEPYLTTEDVAEILEELIAIANPKACQLYDKNDETTTFCPYVDSKHNLNCSLQPGKNFNSWEDQYKTCPLRKGNEDE